MTQNQIAYWNMQEAMRSNRAKERLGAAEQESKRVSAAAATKQAQASAHQAETARLKQQEEARHNKEMEDLKGAEMIIDTLYEGVGLGAKALGGLG